jgi:hypothetical protein
LCSQTEFGNKNIYNYENKKNNYTTKKTILYCILAIASIIFFTGTNKNSFAQGGYADALLQMGIGSRSEAMGRAYTAVVGDPESAFFNPASSTAMEKRMVDLSIRALPLDRSFAYLGFSTALRPKSKNRENDKQPLGGGLALSWIHAGVSEIDGRDSDGEKFGSFSNNQNLVNFTFALRVKERVAIGLTTRLFWNRFPGLGEDGATISSRAFGFDFGMLISVTDGVWLGAVYKNFNAKFTWDSSALYERGKNTNNKFPQVWRIGFSTTRLYEKLLLAVDLESSDKQDPKIYAGGDFLVMQQTRLRAGLRDGDLTLGVAYSFQIGRRQSTLHYAFVSQPNEVRTEHIFSWSFGF